MDHLVVVLPVAPPETADLLRGLVDKLIVISTPSPFGAVGAFYDDFRQVSADEVKRLLDEATAQGRALSRPAPARDNRDAHVPEVHWNGRIGGACRGADRPLYGGGDLTTACAPSWGTTAVYPAQRSHRLRSRS